MTKGLASVTIVRRIKAPPARVYAAITQPRQMLQWWGPDAGPTLRAEAEVRKNHEQDWTGLLDKLSFFVGDVSRGDK